jgi:hypothetical protein
MLSGKTDIWGDFIDRAEAEGGWGLLAEQWDVAGLERVRAKLTDDRESTENNGDYARLTRAMGVVAEEIAELEASDDARKNA